MCPTMLIPKEVCDFIQGKGVFHLLASLPLYLPTRETPGDASESEEGSFQGSLRQQLP